MSYVAPRTWVTGEIVSAAQLNQDIRDNIDDLHRRTTAPGASVAANESTASLTYVNLTTTGPAVTATVGGSGLLLVAVKCRLYGSALAVEPTMGFDVSGASTITNSDDHAVSTSTTTGANVGATRLLNLAAGSNTCTAKYKVGSAGTGNFLARHIAAVPLGS